MYVGMKIKAVAATYEVRVDVDELVITDLNDAENTIKIPLGSARYVTEAMLFAVKTAIMEINDLGQ